MEASIIPAIQELTRCYQALVPLFAPSLDSKNPPIILIQSRGKRNAYGWMARENWKQEESSFNEITITAEYLARPTEEIMETLVHEMVHHANALDGIDDCSRNQYHRESFRDRAESVGLVVEKEGRRGWSKTALSNELKERIQGLKVDAAAFKIFHREYEKRPVNRKPTKIWACECTVVRSASVVEAVCSKCDKAFRESTK